MAFDTTSEDPPVPHGPFPPSWLEESHYYLAFRLRNTNLKHDPSWYDSEYFPEKDKPSERKWERAARRLADENHKAIFHCMPAELRDMVTILLGNADILSLRATCREMRRDFTHELDARQQSLTRNDRIEFTRRLYIDRFTKMSEVEMSQRDNRANTEMLCGFCLVKHPADTFAPDELAKPPFMRACRGALGKFIPCEHGSLSFVEILRKLGTRNETYLCPIDDAHEQTIEIKDGNQHCPPKLRRLRGSLGFRTRNGFTLDKVFHGKSSNGKVPERQKEIVNQRIIDRDTYLCPHLRTSSRGMWQHEVEGSSRGHGLGDGLDVYVWPSNVDHRCFARCGETSCKTLFGFAATDTRMEWKPLKGAHVYQLRFQVWRDVGPLHDVCDERWMAQLDSV